MSSKTKASKANQFEIFEDEQDQEDQEAKDLQKKQRKEAKQLRQKNKTKEVENLKKTDNKNKSKKYIDKANEKVIESQQKEQVTQRKVEQMKQSQTNKKKKENATKKGDDQKNKGQIQVENYKNAQQKKEEKLQQASTKQLFSDKQLPKVLLAVTLICFLIIYFVMPKASKINYSKQLLEQNPHLNQTKWPNFNNNMDQASLSNLHEAKMLNFNWNYYLNFDQEIVEATTEIYFQPLIGNLSTIYLDVSNIQIYNVSFNGYAQPFQINTYDIIGEQLQVNLTQARNLNDNFSLIINYSTKPNSDNSVQTALNWLKPQQTSSKTQPYFYTQCQTILVRSLIPCQDAPQAKITYNATAKVKKGIKIFMGAKCSMTHEDDSFNYFYCEQNNLISPYLISIVAGNLVEKFVSQAGDIPISIISEPDKIKYYSQQLEHISEYLAYLQNFLGTYVWEKYSVVLMPPSFPYGGMENPIFTFVTSEIITGDRSFHDVLLHEMTHAWSGNLMTCETWEDFWLNEGITMYIQREILQQMYGDDHFLLHTFKDHIGLLNFIKFKGSLSDATKLMPKLNPMHPDEIISLVPYEKGFQFLHFLKFQIADNDKFNNFIIKLIWKYKFSTISTKIFMQEYKAFGKEYFSKISNNKLAQFQQIKYKDWIFSPGDLPQKVFAYKIPPIGSIHRLSKSILSTDALEYSTAIIQYKNMSVLQKIIFLTNLVEQSEKVQDDKIGELYEYFNIKTEIIPEIKVQFYALTLAKQNEVYIEEIKEFLSSKGRMGYLLPIYKQLIKFKKDLALEIVESNKLFYHSIAYKILKSLF